MIDFRYHLVSIIAVFLALAVGLAVGSTALTGTAEQALTAAQHRLTSQNNALTRQNGLLQHQVAGDQAFASANSARLLAGLLTDERVVLIAAPGADSAVTSGLTTALRAAGATVTGQVTLTSAFTTTSGQNEAALAQLAQNLASSAGLTLRAVPAGSSIPGQQDAAQVLAAGLLGSSASLTTASSEAILTGFSRGGFISVDSGAPASAPANLAVLVTPGGPPPQQDGSEVLMAVARELQAAGSGTVMAGAVSSIGAGSVISAENSAGNTVSTVDNADTETGQIMVVQALRFLLDGKAPQAFGAEPARRAQSRTDSGCHADAESEFLRPGEGSRMSGRSLRTALVAAAAVRTAYGALRARPPAGAATWTRTNHRGETVTLLAGPAVAIGGLAGALAAGTSRRDRLAAVLAAAGAATFGGYDDLAGDRGSTGFRGHLGALRHGELTTGAVKLAGIGAAGLAAALVADGGSQRTGAVDSLINAGLVAGSANLINLFDLRPGRAIKATVLAGGVLAAASGGAASVSAPVAAAAALLPEDLGERAMLGDAGANALGALLGMAAATSLRRRDRLAVLSVIAGLTAASEFVSFTQVIERTGPLRWLDMLGRRPPGQAGQEPAKPEAAEPEMGRAGAGQQRDGQADGTTRLVRVR